MEISPEAAQESLNQVEDTMERARKMMAYRGADIIFIIWGVVWFLGYLSSFASVFLIKHEWTGFLVSSAAWGILTPAGIIATWRVARRATPPKSRMGKRIGSFWWLLFIYIYVWYFLLQPFIKVNGVAESLKFYNHMNALVATVPMFGYVGMGLLMDNFLVYVGLAVTGLILAGLLLFPTYFLLWMAIVGGGSLAGTGLFIHNRWK